MRRAEPRAAWADRGLVLVGLLVLLSGFRVLLSGHDWWITTVLVMGLVALTCGVGRGLGLRRIVAPIAVIVWSLAVCWIFASSTLWAMLPTPSTVRELNRLLVDAREIIIEEQPPVTATAPVVLLIAASFGLLVILADLILQVGRSAPLVGALFVAVFLTPAAIAGVTPSAWEFVLVAALWLVLLRSRSSSPAGAGWSHRAPALALGAAALAGAAVFPTVTPDVDASAASSGVTPGPVFGRGINPMLELGKSLRRNGERTALEVSTTAASAPYLKVATLRDFAGRTWEPSRSGGRGIIEARQPVTDGVEVTTDTTAITIVGLRSSMLPVPYAATNVDGLRGQWTYERLGSTVRAVDTSDTRGQSYSVTSRSVEPTAEQMRDAGAPTSLLDVDAYLSLPDKMPAIIGNTAREVTADVDNDYDRAMALQSYLRGSDFTYSETAPVDEGYDGNGVSVIARFLREKAGYCVHFSSTMAVMARTLDIPSRIAVGYAPGTSQGANEDGETVYENTSSSLHAWTELYFEGIGWVRFDPTPGIGAATRFAEPQVESVAPDGTPIDPSTAGSENPGQGDTSITAEDSAAAPTAAPSTAPRTVAVTLGGIVVLGAAPWLVRAVRRRWRRRLGATSPDPLWRELQDTALDHGLDTSVSETPRQFAARLRARRGVDATALDHLLEQVETSRFARNPGVSDGRPDLAAVVASIRAGATRVELVRAVVLPRSLAGRRTYAPSTEPSPAY